MKINTVLGPLDSAELGITSMHEHIPLDKAGANWEDAYQFTIAELKTAYRLGLRTLVEISPRRDAEGIRRVAETVGMNIIVCTGYYTDFTPEEDTYPVSEFQRHMLDEFEHGIGSTGIYPGVIKIASANPVPNETECRALTAAALVQKATGLPLCVHSVTGCKNQQDIFEAAGANLAQVYFSHTEAVFGWEGRTLLQQLDYLRPVLQKGSTLCYNNFGNWAHTPVDTLAGLIDTLNAHGFEDQQVTTMDCTWSYPDGERAILWQHINPDGIRRTYPYLLSDVAPWLKAQNFSSEFIIKMLEANPRHLFEEVKSG